jgi:uncharacterized protein YndB with AHSA1/START domain
MISVDYDVAIRREPADVFEYVTQVERIPEWQHVAGVRKVTKTDDGPLRVGSRFSMQRESRSGVATIDCEVTALEPGREFDFHSIDNDGFAGDFRTTVTPNADGTNLHWSVRMQPPNLLFRLLQPMIAREIRKSADSDFVNLKRILEASATA